jgi:hypothetical protein
MKLLTLFIALALATNDATADIIYSSAGSVYTQDFNSLSSGGLSNPWMDDATIDGWFANKTSYVAQDGTVGAFGLQSLGTGADRALGSQASASAGHIRYGVRLTNNTGQTLTAFRVTYDGEQWIDEVSGSPQQKIDFAYVTGVNPSLTSTGYVDVDALDFAAPVTTGASPATPLNGNDPGNRVAGITHLVTGVAWNPGEQLLLRWTDLNDANGGDHALGIDNFSISAVPEASSLVLASAVALLHLGRRLFKR